MAQKAQFNKGITLLYNKEDVEKFKRELAERQKKINNLAYPMRKIALRMETSVIKNFIAEGRPKKWEGLSDATLIRRRKGKGTGTATILSDTGILRQSISSIWDKMTAKVGTNLVYGAVHQFGFVRHNIPERPFLMFQQGEAEKYNDMIADFIK